MEPIRILQIFTILNRGGAETNIMNYYRKIDRTKIQFDFVVHRTEIGEFEEEIQELGGKIYRLPRVNPLRLKKYKTEINTFFNNHNYKIIHGHCSELGFYIYKEAHRRKVPVIIAHSHNSKVNYDLKLPFRMFWKKNMIKYLTAYFSCGDQASVWLFGKEKSKQVHVMRNAIDTSLFSYKQDLSILKRAELNAQKTLNIINIGSFIASKNHEFVLDVFHEFTKINPNSKLFFVGKGHLLSAIQNKVQNLNLKEKVVFLGVRNDVNQILQAMDLLLFPSKFEGLPLSLIECQTAGLKCIISDKIPNEAVLYPENVEIISLNKTKSHWAKQMSIFQNHSKQDISNVIIERRYDITQNAIELQNKYLELLEKS